MKKYLPYSLILAAAATGLAHGAATAYTTPVGYLSVTIPANSDTTVSPSLSSSPLLKAAATAIATNTVTFASTGITSGSFVNAAPDLNSKSYLLVSSGPLAGLRFPITANTATTVTVNAGATSLQAQGFLTGATFSVVPYWTLNTLFPAGLGVGVSTDPFSPSAFVLFSDQESVAVNRAPSKLYFYFGGDVDLPAGWYDNDNIDGGLQNTVAIDPSVQLTIRNSAFSSVTVSGEVPSTPLSTVFLTSASASNDEYLASPFPVDTTLAQSGLQSAIVASTDAFSPTDFVFVYPDTGAGVNKAPAKLYFYFAGDVDLPAGWYDNDNIDGGVVTGAVIKAGRSFGVRKSAGPAAVTRWTAPLPYAL